jgi:hypothetical protein
MGNQEFRDLGLCTCHTGPGDLSEREYMSPFSWRFGIQDVPVYWGVKPL